MKWIERKISVFLKNADIPKEDISIVDFGLRQGCKSIFGFLLAVILGTIMQIPLWSIVFLACYIALRTYAGGYHADSEKKCAVLSTVSIIAVFSYIKWGWENNTYIFFSGVVGLLILYVWSPVENPWHRLTCKEKHFFKKIAVVLATLLFFVAIGAIYFDNYRLSKCMLAAILLSAVNVLVGYMKYKFLSLFY